VGCEIDTVFDPALDERLFASLVGPQVKSIVRRQPTISELVCDSMGSAPPALQNEPTGGMIVGTKHSNTLARDLDFQHLRQASGNDLSLHRRDDGKLAKPAMKETGKRKATFEDAFTDFEFDDDFELDEAELKELDRLESPQKLANGNYKCNHQCKDKTKYPISVQNTFLTVTDADTCVAKKAR